LIGGEAIHDSSMCSLQHQHKRAPSPNDDFDEENQPPTEDQPAKKTHCSFAKANSSNLSSDFTDLMEMLWELECCQEAVNKEMVEMLQESTKVYERTSDRYFEVIMQLTCNQITFHVILLLLIL
jgi:predicted transcriptional regulator